MKAPRVGRCTPMCGAFPQRTNRDTRAASKAVLTRFLRSFRERKEKQDKDLASLPSLGLPHLPAVRAVSRVRKLASLWQENPASGVSYPHKALCYRVFNDVLRKKEEL